MVRMVLRKARKNGYNQKHMILVGYSRAAEQYIDRILANPEWGYAVRGILDDHQPRGMGIKGQGDREYRQSAGHSSAESDR